jgi:hypothetical protein
MAAIYDKQTIRTFGESFAVSDAGLLAARIGTAGCAKLNAKTGIADITVLTDSGFLIPITTGKQVVVVCFYVHLNTVSDWLDFEFIYTANADGTGDAVALSPKMRIETGAAAAADMPAIVALNPPVLVKYSTTSKAVTMRVQAADASASATLGMNYWTEDITTA